MEQTENLNGKQTKNRLAW